MNKSKEWISMKDACKILKVSRWTLKRRMNEHKIKGYTIGRNTIINRRLLIKAFEPIIYTAKENKTPLDKPLIRKRIQLIIKGGNVNKSKFFDAEDLDKQVEWLEAIVEAIRDKKCISKTKVTYQSIKHY